MTILIADCETDDLLPNMTKLWCVQLGDADGDDVVLYGDQEHCDRPLAEGLARLKAADKTVFHNGLSFDFWAINHFFPGTLRFEQQIDTIILSRMKRIADRQHALDVHGRRLGVLKGSFKGPYDVWTKEFADYSRQDVVVGRALWHDVKDVLEWCPKGGTPGSTYEIEARAAYCISLQEQNGFTFNVAEAEKLHGVLAQEMADLKVLVREAFPDFKREYTFVPKVNSTKFGYQKGVPFTKRWDDEFNPRSRQMIAEALIRDGWKPKEFTKTGQPEVTADTLAGLHQHPGAQVLVKYLRLSKILGAILGEKVGKGYLQIVKPDGRIHGRVTTLGATTWRMTHSNPNSANVDKDPRVRSLFTARAGWSLVGCDGSEIQARFLAHYLHPLDNGDYARKLLHGDKKIGTDGHSMNLVACKPFGLVSRDGAKTALYAKLFGARWSTMADTISEDRTKHGEKPIPESRRRAMGQAALDALGRTVVGLDTLLTNVQGVGKTRGYLVGIGGGRIPISAAHAALVGLLQNGEATAMKMALGIFEFEMMPKLGYHPGDDYAYVANVHDEVQFECRPEIAEELGMIFAECITEAGIRLRTNCPLAGEFKVGTNWTETH